jgi:hypothetical protein
MNTEIMKETLHIVKKEGPAELIKFLRENHPNVLDIPVGLEPVYRDDNNIFPRYKSGLITFPRREIFTGQPKNLKRGAARFSVDKGYCDDLVVGSYLYVEYLYANEKHLLSKIPEKNWLLKAYRKNNVENRGK